MAERIIGYYCGPALAGIKPANIASLYKAQTPNVRAEIECLHNTLLHCGIHLEILCECEKRVLVMAYRSAVLEKHLANPEYRAFLKAYGYPVKGGAADCIQHLKLRLSAKEFPHEIGVFLGYPLHDICGFMEGKDCLLTGEWKVYKDAEKAEKLFTRYRACRCGIVRRLESGRTLSQIFCAA